MANEKILIFESAWSERIEDTRSTREIYSSAETLLGLGPSPVRIIQRPLVSSTYLGDIKKFIALECNKRGLNIIIFSAHGCHTRTKKGRHKRKLEALDQEIEISEIRKVSRRLSRTIIVLDSYGKRKTFRRKQTLRPASGLGRGRRFQGKLCRELGNTEDPERRDAGDGIDEEVIPEHVCRIVREPRDPALSTIIS